MCIFPCVPSYLKIYRVFLFSCVLYILWENIRSNVESSDDEQPRVEKLSLKKKGIGSEARATRMANADVDFQLLGEAERGRLLQKQKKRRLQGREDDVRFFIYTVYCMWCY